jgi:hypothetical protein
MKIKKHLQIDAITNSTGRLPSDMENLKVYHHSSSTGEPINVGDMDLTYLIRAYAKCQKQLLQEVRIDTQEGKIKDQAIFYDNTIENNDKIYKKNLQEQEDKILSLTSQIENLKSDLAKQTSQTEYWRDAYYKSSTVKGDVKMFSEIPNDASGRAFVAQLKEYLNTESYSVRVRGQYLNDATKQAEGWRPYSYGQPISKSKCLRVYVDTK